MAQISARLIVSAAFIIAVGTFLRSRAQDTPKPNVTSQRSLLDFTLQNNTLADVQDRLGTANIGQCSQEVEPVAYICYTSKRDETNILFQSDGFSSPRKLSGFTVAAANGSVPCRLRCIRSAAFGSDVQTHGGLRLGLTKAELEVLLGPPSQESGNRLTFQWRSKKPMTQEEIDRAAQTFKAPAPRAYFDVHDTVKVVLIDSKVAQFEVRTTITY